MKKQEEITLADVCKYDESKNIITIIGVDGPESYNLDDFIEQSIEGILYDLGLIRSELLRKLSQNNKQEALKYVNQFAAMRVISKLKETIDMLNQKIN